MIFRTQCVPAAILALGLLGVCPMASATAAAINYGDFLGTTVTFYQVTEDSGTDPTPLFGAPTLSGDALSFNPPSFNASSQLQTPPLDFTDGTLTTTIMANQGQSIEELRFMRPVTTPWPAWGPR